MTGSHRLRKIVENEDAPMGMKARAIYAISLMPDAIEDSFWLLGHLGTYLQLPIIECLFAFEVPLHTVAQRAGPGAKSVAVPVLRGCDLLGLADDLPFVTPEHYTLAQLMALFDDNSGSVQRQLWI